MKRVSLRVVEDDHVDRPGVEERQRLKLTGTNNSIDLIVLIPNVHQNQRSRMSGPNGPMLREGAGRPATRTCACGLSPEVMISLALVRPSGGATRVRRTSADGRMKRHKKQLLDTMCALPTWWLWRGGCTRSHSELGRETLQR